MHREPEKLIRPEVLIKVWPWDRRDWELAEWGARDRAEEQRSECCCEWPGSIHRLQETSRAPYFINAASETCAQLISMLFEDVWMNTVIITRIALFLCAIEFNCHLKPLFFANDSKFIQQFLHVTEHGQPSFCFFSWNTLEICFFSGD